MSELHDLVALVADGHQAKVLETLLSCRRESLGIREVTPDVYPHPLRDPGVYKQAEGFLASYRRSHRYALVMLDVQFPGSPGSQTKLEQELQSRLDAHGWESRSQVIAIDPELEAWVWTDSPHLEQVLGQTREQIRHIAAEKSWWPPDSAKPLCPKELLHAVVRRSRRPPSAALFAALAECVGLQRCTDPAFARLRDTLRAWFGSQ